METKYQLIGMTCSGCEYKVKYQLEQVDGITNATANKEQQTVTITHAKQLPLAALQAAIDEKYTIQNIAANATSNNEDLETQKSWWITYKPILLVFAYITGTTLLIQVAKGSWDTMEWMRHFMAGFFLIFSFFKLINLKGFASSYQMYDIVAKALPAWSYLYAFLELALGLAYLIDFQPLVTNIVTTLVMSISIIGVLKTVLNKQKIQCACLGAIFNLPMSTVTIIEDGLMILMSGWMVFHYLS